MANEEEKAWRSLGGLVQSAKEILKLENALKVAANSEGAIARVEQREKEAAEAIAALKLEEGRVQAGIDKAKADAVKEKEKIAGEVETERARLRATLGPEQTKLGQVQAQLAAAKIDLTNTVDEKRRVNAEVAEREKYLGNLNANIKRLQEQHGITA